VTVAFQLCCSFASSTREAFSKSIAGIHDPFEDCKSIDSKAKLIKYPEEYPAAKMFLGTNATVDAAQFCSLVREGQELSKFELESMTWVKALASPLSYEYIQ